jgi:tetratricopeptide (TPR) repeat protein
MFPTDLSRFWGVFWVDVSTTGTAERSFLDVAQKLSIPAQTWDDARLCIANLKRPWLLILDNADDPGVDYQDYFPDGALGVVMLTSRNHECQQYATVKSVALKGLSNEEAQELLLKAACVPQDRYSIHEEDAVKVASLLQSHPLALIQAGAYVSRGHCSLAEYPQVFAQQRQRLLGFRPAQGQSRYRDVYATFEASANILRSSRTESAADALQLLPVLATCGPSRLPLALFEAGWKGARSISSSDDGSDDVIELTSWHVSRLPSLMQAAAARWDSFRLIEAINLLKAFSLVSTDTHSGFVSVSMHPLTHAWARDRQETTEQHDSWITTGCLVAVSRDDDAIWRQHGQQLQPHVQALTGWEISKMFASEPAVKITSISVKCGWLLYNMRDDAKVFVLMQRLLIHLGLDRQTVDKKWLELYDLMARNLVNYGKANKAVAVLEQVVKIREQKLTEDHPDRLASQHALGRAYEANGQIKKALLLLEQVVKIRERTLAENDPSRLASQHELARAYQANRQDKEAVLLLEQVVKIREQTLAEDHPDRLASRHELGRAYNANGQVSEAVLLLEHVVKIREQTLAEDHPNRLDSQDELARAYQANGQITEAVSLLEHVVKIQEQSLAEDHPYRLGSQHVLAMAYLANGQVKEAVLLLEQVVKIEEQTLAEDHPDRLASQLALAMAYEANGQVKEAVLLPEQVVKIEEQTLAEDHPYRLVSQHALAMAYEANGQVKEAVLLLEHVVKVREQSLAEDHRDRLASQLALAMAYEANGQISEAVSLLE